MKLLEWLAIWFGPQPQPKADPLRETLEEGRRRKFAEDYPGALAACESVRAQLQPDDVLLATAVELFIGEVQIEAGDFASAEAQIERVAATANYPAQLIYLAQARGLLAQARGDLDAARTHYEEARAQAKEAQLITAEMSTAGHLAEVVLLDGNAAYAVHLLRENLPRLQTFNDPDLRCAFIGVYGLALIETGQAAEGLDMLRNALTLSEAAGYVKYERRWLLALAEQAIKDGRYYDAGAHLERALRLSDRLGGHIVTGHVDGKGIIRGIERRGDFVRIRIQAPPSILAYVIEKGSIAVDGISLTVNSCSRSEFDLMIIPHTLARTTLRDRKVGDQVNLENDILAKYVEKFLSNRPSTGITEEMLRQFDMS
jgi:tetratricopeptide (TPR) repeat protein